MSGDCHSRRLSSDSFLWPSSLRQRQAQHARLLAASRTIGGLPDKHSGGNTYTYLPSAIDQHDQYYNDQIRMHDEAIAKLNAMGHRPPHVLPWSMDFPYEALMPVHVRDPFGRLECRQGKTDILDSNDGEACHWFLLAATPDEIVHVMIDVSVDIWPGEDLTIRAGTDEQAPLLASLTGRGPWPTLSAKGAISVRGTTKFGLMFNTNATGCSGAADCAGGVCRADGLCECSPGRAGSDCTYEQMCVGELVRTAERGVFKSSNHALTPYGHDYMNLANCTFVVRVSSVMRYVRFNMTYEVEEMQDYIHVYGGALGKLRPSIRLTGSSRATVVTVPTHDGIAKVSFSSDEIGRRLGFIISYEVDTVACRSGARDCSGHGSCEEGRCKCDLGWYGDACSSASCLNFNLPQSNRIESHHRDHAGETFSIEPGLDCTWPLKPQEESIGIRITWETFDLEPADTLEAAGDFLQIRGLDDLDVLPPSHSRLAVVRCKLDDECDIRKHPWMAGVCKGGVCLVTGTVYEILYPDLAKLMPMPNRSEVDAESSTGKDVPRKQGFWGWFAAEVVKGMEASGAVRRSVPRGSPAATDSTSRAADKEYAVVERFWQWLGHVMVISGITASNVRGDLPMPSECSDMSNLHPLCPRARGGHGQTWLSAHAVHEDPQVRLVEPLLLRLQTDQNDPKPFEGVHARWEPLKACDPLRFPNKICSGPGAKCIKLPGDDVGVCECHGKPCNCQCLAEHDMGEIDQMRKKMQDAQRLKASADYAMTVAVVALVAVVFCFCVYSVLRRRCLPRIRRYARLLGRLARILWINLCRCAQRIHGALRRAYKFVRSVPDMTIRRYLIVSEPTITLISLVQLPLRACSIIECAHLVARIAVYSTADNGVFDAVERLVFAVNTFYTVLYVMLTITEIVFSYRAVVKESASDLLAGAFVSFMVSALLLAEEVYIRRSQMISQEELRFLLNYTGPEEFSGRVGDTLDLAESSLITPWVLILMACLTMCTSILSLTIAYRMRREFGWRIFSRFGVDAESFHMIRRVRMFWTLLALDLALVSFEALTTLASILTDLGELNAAIWTGATGIGLHVLFDAVLYLAVRLEWKRLTWTAMALGAASPVAYLSCWMIAWPNDWVLPDIEVWYDEALPAFTWMLAVYEAHMVLIHVCALFSRLALLINVYKLVKLVYGHRVQSIEDRSRRNQELNAAASILGLSEVSLEGIHHVSNGQVVLVALEPMEDTDAKRPSEVGAGLLATFRFKHAGPAATAARLSAMPTLPEWASTDSGGSIHSHAGFAPPVKKILRFVGVSPEIGRLRWAYDKYIGLDQILELGYCSTGDFSKTNHEPADGSKLASAAYDLCHHGHTCKLWSRDTGYLQGKVIDLPAIGGSKKVMYVLFNADGGARMRLWIEPPDAASAKLWIEGMLISLKLWPPLDVGAEEQQWLRAVFEASDRNRSGLLERSDLRTLLNAANLGNVGQATIESALGSEKVRGMRLIGHLNFAQATRLLIALQMPSDDEVAALYRRYCSAARLSADDEEKDGDASLLQMPLMTLEEWVLRPLTLCPLESPVSLREIS